MAPPARRALPHAYQTRQLRCSGGAQFYFWLGEPDGGICRPAVASAIYHCGVSLLLIPNPHNVVAQQSLLVRLFVEECARNIARVDDA